jgi:BirA family biotin operon repressor/biotin-[acetyl-CoA-carboxylase] ligase
MRMKVRHQPGGSGFGVPRRHFRRTDSTNARARTLAERGAPGGTVVTADEQTAGRGRQGRVWTAPPGGALLYSAILRPLDERHLLLPLAVPVAVCEAAEELATGLSAADAGRGGGAVECRIKWPNDVWLGGRKLAGVLIEAKPQDGWAVIGVGLNLAIEAGEFPPELRDRAISLAAPGSGAPARSPNRAGRERDGRDGGAVPVAPTAGSEPGGRAGEIGGGHSPGPPMRAMARKLLDERLGRWVEADAQTILAAWRERDALRGREVAWEDGSGVADGVDDRGRLAVVVPGGDRVLLGAGEVHLRL